MELNRACEYSESLETVAALLAAHPGGVRVKDGRGSLPLHLACANHSAAGASIVEAVLEAYPDAVHESELRGMLPLHVACQESGAVGVVCALLAAYPDAARVKDDHGGVPCQLNAELNAPDQSDFDRHQREQEEEAWYASCV